MHRNRKLVSHGWGARQVRTLLDTGVPMPQTPDLFDNAILRDDLPMIKLLLKYNASPTSQTLQTVLRAKRDDILLLLLQAGLSPNQKWSIAKPNLKIIGSVGWWTPLHQVYCSQPGQISWLWFSVAGESILTIHRTTRRSRTAACPSSSCCWSTKRT